jgi:putative tryptophan/tyrosine transport system substrate-binding protein
MATLGHVEELADDDFLMTFGPSGVLMIPARRYICG